VGVVVGVVVVVVFDGDGDVNASVGGPLTTKSPVSGCFVAVAVAVKDHVNVNDYGICRGNRHSWMRTS
jgi:hypothetical protein